MFIWGKNDLSNEQENAVILDQNILLIACPGSGKTRTLTFKIALELSKLKSVKKYVIAITYTHRAAEEIKDRVELLGVDTSQLWIGTIHSFCQEWILKPYHIYSDDLKSGYSIIDDHVTEELISELCKPYSSRYIKSYDCNYIITSKGYILNCPTEWKHQYIDEILNKYWKMLNQRKLIDFEMMLYYSHQLISQNSFIGNTLSKIFSYIMIDEYQDTKEIQYSILSRMMSVPYADVKAFIVGDPNQSIFKSLGGTPISQSELETLTGKPFKELSLSKNYRSSKLIISYFDHYKTYSNLIFGCGKHKDYKSIISCNRRISKNELIDEIAKLILFNIKEKSISPNEICVVAPQWIHLASLTRKLIIKLPDYSFNGPGMAPFARDIDNFFYKLSRIVLTEPAPNMYTNRLRWSSEILKELEHYGFSMSHVNAKKLLRYSNSIILNENDGINYLKSYFTDLLQKLNVDISVNHSLNQQFDSFFQSSEQRIQKLIEEGNDTINTTENFKKVFKQKDGITISTIHGIKGAEFDTVICFALLQGYIPHGSDKEGDISAKKMLYVISSRAKKNLHLISETGRYKKWAPDEEYLTTEVLAEYKFRYDNC